MKSKRKFPWWAIVLVVIALFIGGKVWFDSALTGEFDVTADFPSNEMLVHIVEHAQELIEKDERFVRSSEEEGNYSFYFSDEDVFGQVTITPDAIATLQNPDAVPMVPVSGTYSRQNISDFVDIATPWSPCSVTIGVIYDAFAIVAMGSDLPAPTTAPMTAMMDAIVSIIGQP